MRWWLLVLVGCGRVGFNPLEGGGATGDGGERDAADGATQVATTCLAHTGAIFCEDFETDLSRWNGGVIGTPAIQSANANGGTKALLTTTTPGPDQAYIQYNLPALITSGSLYVRAWLFVTSATDARHIDLFDATGFSEGIVAMGYGNTIDIYVGLGATPTFPGPAIIKDQWFCIEYRIDIADSGGGLELRFNDQVAISQSGFDTLPNAGGTGYTRIKTGIPYAAPGEQLGPATVYTDDVVVDTAPIGCAP